MRLVGQIFDRMTMGLRAKEMFKTKLAAKTMMSRLACGQSEIFLRQDRLVEATSDVMAQ